MAQIRRRGGVKYIALAATAALMIAGCADSDTSYDEDDSFAADEVTWLIPVPPGASFDTFARAVAPYVGEELGASIKVENRPGASGLVALNEMAVAEPDGSTIALWQMGPVAIAQLEEIEQLRFDMEDLSYIGNFADSDHMLFVSEDSDIQDVDDIETGFSFASGELGSLGYTSQQILDDIFDLDAKFVTGYDDQGQRMDAIERGDADGVIGPVRTFESIGRLDDVRPVLRLANQRHPSFDDVPTALEIDELSDDDKEILQTQFDMASLFFTVMGPEGLSDGVLNDMREAFWTVANDDDVLNQLTDSGLELDPENEYLTGEEVEDLIPEILDVPADYQAMLDEISQAE